MFSFLHFLIMIRPTQENANYETFAIRAFSLQSLDSNW